jgi:hypothetical protein
LKSLPSKKARAARYTLIQLAGEGASELEKFLNNQACQATEGFEDLVARLQDMVDEFGFSKQFFKESEGKRTNALHALAKGRLRLYCLRWNEVLLVTGYGGIKTTRTYQQDRTLDAAVELLQEVDRRLATRQKSGEINIDFQTGELSGNLIFNKGDET